MLVTSYGVCFDKTANFPYNIFLIYRGDIYHMRAKDVMSRDVITVGTSAGIREVYDIFKKTRYGGIHLFPVTLLILAGLI